MERKDRHLYPRFLGTELSTGAFQAAALTKGYAFASCDEGWFRGTIADNPQDDYYESRQSLVELTVYTKRSYRLQYGTGRLAHVARRNLQRRPPHQVMVEAYPLMFDGGISGFGYNSQLTQWGSVSRVVRNYDVIARAQSTRSIAERARRNPQCESVSRSVCRRRSRRRNSRRCAISTTSRWSSRTVSIQRRPLVRL